MSVLTEDVNSNLDLLRKLSNDSFLDNQILADLTFAQAILEGGLLNSPPSKLAYKYNNVFGIKGAGTAGSINLNTTEYINGQEIEITQRFAVNNSIEDSLQQHKNVLSLSRYSNLYSISTFEKAAAYIQQDGYATDNNYTKELIDIYYQYIKS